MEKDTNQEYPVKSEVIYNGYFLWYKTRQGKQIYARQVFHPDMLPREREIDNNTPIEVGYEGYVPEELGHILEERDELRKKVKLFEEDALHEYRKLLDVLMTKSAREPRFGWRN